MDQSKEKRNEIFRNYKESIKRAKFAPLSKYALNIGNPLDVNENTTENTQVNQDIDQVYFEYKLKLVEEKLKRMTVISILSLVMASVSIIVQLYNS